MISAVRRHHVVCLAFVASAGAFASAQTWPAIPPIPPQERFRPGSDLAVTLKLNASQLMAGEPPTFTLTLLNSGSSTLRVPPYPSTNSSNVALRLFDRSGNELVGTYSCTVDR
jgi:hypothetical protein